MRIPNVTAVLFDLDGTLIDTETQTRVAIAKLLREFGYAVTPQQLQNIAGRTLPDWLRHELEIPSSEVNVIDRAYRESAALAIAAAAKPLPYAQALIDGLSARGVPIGIVTTRFVQTARVAMEAVGWSDHFQVLVGQDTTPKAKPAPEPALFALRALGVRPGNAIMVGDQEADMICASNAGLKEVVGVDSTRPALALRDAGATHVFKDLAEVQALLLGP